MSETSKYPLATVLNPDDTVQGLQKDPATGKWINTNFKLDLLKGLNGKSAYELAVDNGFVGTEQEWLDSILGANAYEVAKLNGYKGTAQEWLASLKGKSSYEIAVEQGFQGTEADFLTSLKGDVGDPGESAYQVAVKEGFVGTEADWLKSLVGKAGVRILGPLNKVSDLPDPTKQVEGDTYVIQGHFWSIVKNNQNQLAWQDIGNFLGPVGASAYQVAVDNGFQGTELEWLDSIRGQDGIGLRILGSFQDVSNLPQPGTNNGDTYIIKEKMYVWDGTQWSTVGQVGPQGKSAYQSAVSAGFQGTEAQWLKTLIGKSAYQTALDNGFTGSESDWLTAMKIKGDKGDDGDSAYEVAVKEGFVGDEAAWLQSLKVKGDQGEPSYAIRTLGKKANESELPRDGSQALGDAYWIGTDLHVWDGTDWENLGSIKGENGLSAFEVAVAEGYKGTTAEWLASLKGGKGDDGDDGASAYQLAVKNGFVGTEAQWLASLKVKGDQGDSAYQVAVANGFTGDEAAWLLSLKGNPGDPAPAVNLIDRITDKNDLPATGNNTNDAYFVNKELYVWRNGAWVSFGDLSGPAGESAYELAVAAGFVGDQQAWFDSLKVKGDKGDDGDSAYEVAVKNGFQGDVTAWLASLKVKGDPGPSAYDAAVAEGFQGTRAQWLASLNGKTAYQTALDNGFKGTEAQWLASLVGATGKSAYQSAVDNGYTGTEADWLKTLVGKQGEDAYQVALKEGFTGDRAAWLDSLKVKGDKGDDGEPSPGIYIDGEVAQESDLPAGGADLGHGYLINGDYWYYRRSDSTWQNAGPIRGEKGGKGDPGDDGKSAYEVAQANGFTGSEADWLVSLKGNPGDKGEQGTIWIVLSRDPQATDGRKGDYYFNMVDQQVYVKTSATAWSSLGHIGGGNLYDAAHDDVKRVLQNGAWVAVAIDSDAVKDGTPYVRQDNGWVKLALSQTLIAGTLPANADAAGQYLLTKNGWVRLDHYDLKVIASTGELDMSLGNSFEIDASANRSITFKNAPAGRSQMLVVTFKGNAGTIGWPTSVAWSDGTTPTYAATRTVIVVYWDGTNYTATDSMHVG
jgi:hypothetical protein